MKLEKLLKVLQKNYEEDGKFEVIGAIAIKDGFAKTLLDNSPDGKSLLDYEDKICVCKSGEKLKVFLKKTEH